MPVRKFKDAVFEHFARMGAALGSPKRVEIVDLRAHGERSVESIAEVAGMSVANTSQHLKVLRSALSWSSMCGGGRPSRRWTPPTWCGCSDHG
jgi:DNA-binding transcriptional ArsR family regulator